MPDYNPYDELYGLLEEQKPKKNAQDQERLKRVTRANVYGQGLKALTEAVTGSMGANIDRRELPKTSLMALNKYYQDDSDFKQREDIYNRARLNLKISDAGAKDAREKAKAAEQLARDKMNRDAAIEAAKMGNSNAKWMAEQEMKVQQNADLNKYRQQRLAQDAKNNESKAADKNKYFGLWYNNETVPIDETQFYAIADIIRKNTNSADDLKEFDMLMQGFKMGDQTSAQQLKLLITQRWSQFPEAMRIGLMGTPYIKDLVQDYSGGQFNPGMNKQQPGANVPWTAPINPQATPPQNQGDVEAKKYVKKAIQDILRPERKGETGKGEMIWNIMIGHGYTVKEAQEQIDYFISKDYDLN